MPLVTETGFAPDDWTRDADRTGARLIAPIDAGAPGADVANTADAAAIAPHFDRLALIAVAFPAFGDGRGFTLARRLRAAGFAGRLRAVGALLPDQHRFARECGFDEIEIDDVRAARQPEADWLADLAPRGNYRAKIRGAA
jgi:uncharacterized protein (DUF934 family)